MIHSNGIKKNKIMTLVEDKSYKRIPCFTFIQTGYCPYQCRCKFIHINGFRGKTTTKIKLKNKVDDTNDLFYYPPKEDKDMRNKDYYFIQKSNLQRLPILEHLSEGKSINVYNKQLCDIITKKRFMIHDRDKQTSRMLYSLLMFIDHEYYMNKNNNFLIKENNNKWERNISSPSCVAEIY